MAFPHDLCKIVFVKIPVPACSRNIFPTLRHMGNYPSYVAWVFTYPCAFSPSSCTRVGKTVPQTCKSILLKLFVSHPVIGWWTTGGENSPPSDISPPYKAWEIYHPISGESTTLQSLGKMNPETKYSPPWGETNSTGFRGWGKCFWNGLLKQQQIFTFEKNKTSIPISARKQGFE